MTTRRIIIDDIVQAIESLRDAVKAKDDVLALVGRGVTPQDMNKMMDRWLTKLRAGLTLLRLDGKVLDDIPDPSFARKADAVIYELRGMQARFLSRLPEDSPFLQTDEWINFDLMCAEALDDLRCGGVARTMIDTDFGL